MLFFVTDEKYFNTQHFFPLYLAFWTKAEQNVWPMRTQPGLENQSKGTVQEPAQPGSQGNHTSVAWTHPGCLLFFFESQRASAPGRSSQATQCHHPEESEVLLPYPQQYQSKLSPPPARALQFKKAQGSPGHLLGSQMHVFLRFTSGLEVPVKIFWFNILWQCSAGQWNWHGCCCACVSLALSYGVVNTASSQCVSHQTV